jgi:hypothetical protein
VHSLLDRSTILAGLVDELRPLLPPLGGALGDLCAGFGRAEAAEQALETAFMIRAAAEMLELDALAEAGRLIETVVPLLHEAPPELLKEGLPVVQSLLTAVEQSTGALVKGGERPDAALEAARSGVARLCELRGGSDTHGRDTSLGLEEMLATLPDLPGQDEVEEELAPVGPWGLIEKDEPAAWGYADALAEPEEAAPLSPWAARLAPAGSLPEPVLAEEEE